MARTDGTAPGHIVFAHANGFPAGVYRKLFEHWRAAGWRVSAPDKIGHDPRFPVTSNWPHLRDELLRFIEHDAGEPAWLVGHSLGGLLSLMAAVHRPAAARGVVLLDSPVLGGWRAGVLRVFKTTGLGARYSPSAVSKRRRQHWPDPQAAFDHFASKPAFARWDPDVLRDYIACGTAPQGGQHTLTFGRDIESAIYDSFPHDLPRLLRRGPPRCPVAFIGGTTSAQIRQVGMGPTQRLVRHRISWIDGGHLYPMERPIETAQHVLDSIATMASAG